MNNDELGVHILYIKRGVDDIKQENQRQWETINHQGKDIAVLNDRQKATRRLSALLGGVVSALILFIVKLLKYI